LRIKGLFIFISVFPYFRISSYFRMGNQTDVTGFVLTLTDAKQNEFVVVSTKESAYQLSTDMRLVVDLIELFFAAACGAFVFVRLLGLPLHGGYVLAGIVIGPSGMNVVGEIVQVRVLFISISISIYFRVGNWTEALCVTLTDHDAGALGCFTAALRPWRGAGDAREGTQGGESGG
jgi:hypothetical protein|tara:strand:+ start:222 stop:749 length:528 start_codon:yes stop_codon:yes gene_type:complete